MDESFDPLKCNEDLPASPGCHMDYGKILTRTRRGFSLRGGHHLLSSLRWPARPAGSGGGPEVATSVSGSSRSVSPAVQLLPKHQLARWTSRHRHKSWEPPAENCPTQEVRTDDLWSSDSRARSSLITCTASLFFFRSSPVHIFGNSNSLHSYARPPLASSAPNPSRGHLRERRRVRVITSHCYET